MYQSPEDQMRFYKSKSWRKLRQQILERDNHECQECKRLGRVTLIDESKHKSLEIDHIKELKDYPHLAMEEDNLITLCIRCHNKKHNRYQPFFRKKKEPITEERW